MPQCPESFANVTAVCKANVYFDGKVVSHTILLEGGEKKTLGLIYPGVYNFGTGLPERMDVVAGACRVKLAGAADWSEYAAGTHFDVPGDSSFDIAVADGVLMEYVCSYIG